MVCPATMDAHPLAGLDGAAESWPMTSYTPFQP